VEREQMDEYAVVEKAAYDGLRFSAYIERHHSFRMCQFLILPSFENPVSWDVMDVGVRRTRPQTRLYRSCCDGISIVRRCVIRSSDSSIHGRTCRQLKSIGCRLIEVLSKPSSQTSVPSLFLSPLQMHGWGAMARALSFLSVTSSVTLGSLGGASCLMNGRNFRLPSPSCSRCSSKRGRAVPGQTLHQPNQASPGLDQRGSRLYDSAQLSRKSYIS
jgi:hypothetical protein